MTRQRQSFDTSIQTNNDLLDNKSLLPGSILEHIANAVIYADKTALEPNRAATELFGYRHSEALHKSSRPVGAACTQP